MHKTWWKESVIYQIYPRSFKDSNGDGVGDLRGIISKLDYLKELGVDILWLSPIYASPNDDNGYDIADYRSIMSEFGTMDDFDEMLEGIHARGMRLLMDLVVNHTSDEHEWFQQSKSSKDSPYRDYYYWSDEKPNNFKSFFGGDAWEYDDQTDSWYLHLFTRKQPDLNWENPKVRQEVYDLMKFWLDKGVDGFRMDVIPLISKRLPFQDTHLPEFTDVIEQVYANGPRIHEFLNEMNREVMAHYDMMTVGEGVGIPPSMANEYVGHSRKEIDMIFHFGHMFIDHGPGGKFDVAPFSLPEFKTVFDQWDEAIGEEGWLNIYLDNHDFPRLVSRFGNDQQYRVESAKMLAILLLTLRGTPCIYQGTEIGMTNVAFPSIQDYRDVETLNIWKEEHEKGVSEEEFLKAVHIQGRDNVRTPIQWDASMHAGFTEGNPWIKVNPNYIDINVEDARADQHSTFYFYQHLLGLRKQHPTWIYGQYEDLLPDHPSLFLYKRWDDHQTYYIILNFSDQITTLPEGYTWDLTTLICSNYTNGHGDLQAWEGRILSM